MELHTELERKVLEPKVQEIKKVYSPEKNTRFLKMLFDLRLKVLRASPENSEKLDGELRIFTDRLKKKYTNPNIARYAMWHALAGSSIDLDRATILYDDFPGEDSVEQFINHLVEEYN